MNTSAAIFTFWEPEKIIEIRSRVDLYGRGLPTERTYGWRHSLTNEFIATKETK